MKIIIVIAALTLVSMVVLCKAAIKISGVINRSKWL